MGWLSRFAISKPVTTIMLVVTMFAMGLISMVGIPVESMPEMDFPVVTVQVSYEGVAPADMDDLVADPIEGAIEGVDEIEDIQSYSNEGATFVVVWFDWGVDLDQKVIDIKDKITNIRRSLPSGIDDPLVSKMDVMGKDEVLSLNLAGEDLMELRKIAEEKLEPKLKRISGVASVDIYGGVEREVLIKVDPNKLSAYNLDINEVIDLIKKADVNLPAGKLKQGDKEFLLRVYGKIESVQQIKDLIIYKEDGQVTFLDDVVEILVGNTERDSYNRMNGNESISLTLIKESGGNTVAISDQVKEDLKNLRGEISQGMELTIGDDSADYIRDSMDMVKGNAFWGLIFASIVLFVFLKNIRATLIVATAIPTSIIFTFVLIKYKGITMNMLSLGGLALGVGMLVDNSVIVLENIYRHMTEERKPVMEAARDGAAEMSLPILASTATTIAVFLPIAFTKGMSGQIFSDFSYTVAFSLLASMLVALTFVPMVSSRTLNKNNTVGKEGKIFKKVKRIYHKSITWVLNRRWRTVALAVSSFIISIVLAVMFIGVEFFPKTDIAGYTIQASLPSGLDIEKANKISKRMEEIISENNQTEKYITRVQKDSIRIDVEIPEKEDRKIGIEELIKNLREKVGKVPDADVSIAAQSMQGGPPGGDIEIKLLGDSYDMLKKYDKLVQESMQNVDGIVDVESSYEGGNPEIKVIVDREKAKYYGLSVAHISSIVNSNMLGVVPLRLQADGSEIDVRVELEEDYRDSIGKIKNLLLTSPSGETVRLQEVADLEISEGPSQVIRQNGSQTIILNANSSGKDLGTITRELREELEKLDFPQGYSYEFGGTQADMQEMITNLGIAFLIAVFLVYMILASQFESFLLPIIIMVSVPLAITGVIIGLLITGFNLSMTVMIGAIMLAGIVVNNAIVLIDYINLLIARGKERHEAIKIAGETRLRPIVMTTMTTIFGMIPLATGRGSGGDFFQPLAIAVIAGLTFSTLLTLLVIPVLYSLLDDFHVWWSKKVHGEKREIIN
ncbi:MAG: efflux RND transporter permease subunit [Fusobacteriota bacterium]